MFVIRCARGISTTFRTCTTRSFDRIYNRGIFKSRFNVVADASYGNLLFRWDANKMFKLYSVIRVMMSLLLNTFANKSISLNKNDELTAIIPKIARIYLTLLFFSQIWNKEFLSPLSETYFQGFHRLIAWQLLANKKPRRKRVDRLAPPPKLRAATIKPRFLSTRFLLKKGRKKKTKDMRPTVNRCGRVEKLPFF